MTLIQTYLLTGTLSGLLAAGITYLVFRNKAIEREMNLKFSNDKIQELSEHNKKIDLQIKELEQLNLSSLKEKDNHLSLLKAELSNVQLTIDSQATKMASQKIESLNKENLSLKDELQSLEREKGLQQFSLLNSMNDKLKKREEELREEFTKEIEKQRGQYHDALRRQSALESQKSDLKSEYELTIEKLKSNLEKEKERAVKAKIEELKQQHLKEIESTKESSRRQARAVGIGQGMQHFLPFIIAQEAGLNHKDLQWMGESMDAIMYDGLTDGGDVTIRLIDFKCSNNIQKMIDASPEEREKYVTKNPFHVHLGDRQKKIKEAFDAGRITFEVWGLDTTTNNFDRFIEELPQPHKSLSKKAS